MEKIPDGVAVIIGSPKPAGSHQFFQTNDFYYFTGVEIPDAVLMMDGDSGKSYLFFSITEEEALAESFSLELVRDPEKVTGVDAVIPIEELPDWLSRFCLRTKLVYTPFMPGELPRENTREKFSIQQKSMTTNMWDGRLTRELQFVSKVKEKFPYVEVEDCSGLIWDLRKIKSPAEIDYMRQAAQIGVKAHLEVMKATRPGVEERQLAALFEYVCISEGAQELAYYVILMSGKNMAYGHYHGYDRVLGNGDILILDAGPDVHYYDADISSTFPASGKFSYRQRELYEMAYQARKVCIENFRPGISFGDVGRKVRQHLISLGYDPDDRKLSPVIRFGGYNHSVGLATHDPMGSFAGPDEILTPGFVFACDINFSYAGEAAPGEEVGIRLEDTVVINETGCEVLSEGLPRSVEEVENFMKRKDNKR